MHVSTFLDQFINVAKILQLDYGNIESSKVEVIIVKMDIEATALGIKAVFSKLLYGQTRSNLSSIHLPIQGASSESPVPPFWTGNPTDADGLPLKHRVSLLFLV